MRLLSSDERLLGDHLRSSEEADVIEEATCRQVELQNAVGDYLNDGADRALLAARLLENCALSLATAERRAGTLLAWREYVQSRIVVVNKIDSPSSSGSTLVIESAAPNLIREQMRSLDYIVA
jgi:hypothetical protein